MGENIKLHRMLWVIPSDLFRYGRATALGQLLLEQYGCDVWLLCDGTALAFSPRGLLVNKGLAVDYPSFLDVTRPLFNRVQKYLVCVDEGTDLHIPDDKFWIHTLLSPNEHDSRYCMYVKSALSVWNPFAFYAYSCYPLQKASRLFLREYLERWHHAASNNDLMGERIESGDVVFSDYHRDDSKASYPRDGFEIRWSRYVPSTWHWIELYLRMRLDIPKKQRCSLYFFNPEK
jgi:hypothetical protein